MSPRAATTIVLIASLTLTFLAAPVTALDGCNIAQYPNGTYYITNPKSLQCRICGFEFGSEPIRCYAFNDTFDGMTPGAKIKEPSRAHWTGLSVAAPGPADPVQPTSHKRYAVTSDSGYAAMNFLQPTQPRLKGIDWWGFGTLQSFDFACANASSKGSYTNEAIPCTLNVTSTCANGTDYGVADEPAVGSDIYPYDPVGSPLAAMVGVGWYVPSPNSNMFVDQLCANYTFVATANDGSPALLYLDNVLYIGWWNWQ